MPIYSLFYASSWWKVKSRSCSRYSTLFDKLFFVLYSPFQYFFVSFREENFFFENMDSVEVIKKKEKKVKSRFTNDNIEVFIHEDRCFDK